MFVGQVEFDSHMASRLGAGVIFVNTLATDMASGRTVSPPASEQELRTCAAAALDQAGAADTAISVREAKGLQQLAERLREVFAAIRDRRHADAAGALNALLVQSGARPQLWRGPEGSWQLHYHASDAGAAQSWTAGCAAGLAHLLTSPQASRLGICAAPRCELVFIDTSRNGSRRFCSTACQSRVKASAHRARQVQRPAVAAGANRPAGRVAGLRG